jgi:hypothetical protein
MYQNAMNAFEALTFDEQSSFLDKARQSHLAIGNQRLVDVDLINKCLEIQCDTKDVGDGVLLQGIQFMNMIIQYKQYIIVEDEFVTISGYNFNSPQRQAEILNQICLMLINGTLHIEFAKQSSMFINGTLHIEFQELQEREHNASTYGGVSVISGDFSLYHVASNLTVYNYICSLWKDRVEKLNNYLQWEKR